MPLRQRPCNLLRQLLRQQAQTGVCSKALSPAPQRSAFSSAGSPRRNRVASGNGNRNKIVKPGPSIFEELFPVEKRHRGSETGGGEAGKAGEAGELRLVQDGGDDGDARRQLPIGDGGLEDLDLGLDALLNMDTARAVDGAEADAAAAAGEPEPTVLVLSGTTASLLPSDFFRIAPRAAAAEAWGTFGTQPTEQHIDGWAAAGGGLYKIVQDRDPATLAPRGRYFLYFGSPAAALAYAQEVRDLYGLARRAVQAPRHRNMGRFREPAGSLGETVGGGFGGGFGGIFGSGIGSSGGSSSSNGVLTEEKAVALRSFTLLPPTAKLDLAMHLPDRTPDWEAATQRGQRQQQHHHHNNNNDAADDAAAADTRTKVLLVLEDTSGGGHDHGSAGGVVTIAELRSLLEADGAARNLPWAVSDGLNGVVPVRWLVAEQRRLQEEEQKGRRKQLQEKEQERKLQERKRKQEQQRQQVKQRKKKEQDEQDQEENQDQNQNQNQEPPRPHQRPKPPPPLAAAGLPNIRIKTAQMNENESFSRFVVTLPDPVEARRFVRSWHRRTVTVPTATTSSELEATAIVDATVLW